MLDADRHARRSAPSAAVTKQLLIKMGIRNTPIGMSSAAEEKALMTALAAATGQQANQFSLRDLRYLPIKNVSKNNISSAHSHVYKSHPPGRHCSWSIGARRHRQSRR
jgi:hypothetical protein